MVSQARAKGQHVMLPTVVSPFMAAVDMVPWIEWRAGDSKNLSLPRKKKKNVEKKWESLALWFEKRKFNGTLNYLVYNDLLQNVSRNKKLSSISTLNSMPDNMGHGYGKPICWGWPLHNTAENSQNQAF